MNMAELKKKNMRRSTRNTRSVLKSGEKIVVKSADANQNRIRVRTVAQSDVLIESTSRWNIESWLLASGNFVCSWPYWRLIQKHDADFEYNNRTVKRNRKKRKERERDCGLKECPFERMILSTKQ